jgi:hypothetical protein
MKDETAARIEYEGNIVSIKLKKILTEAANFRKKTKKEYNAMQEEISKCKGGFWDHQEDIFHALGLKHESYFAGKLKRQKNGVRQWLHLTSTTPAKADVPSMK